MYLIIIALFLAVGNVYSQSIEKVPLLGNAYMVASVQGAPDKIGREGMQDWKSSETVFSIWFHIDSVSELQLAIEMDVTEGESVLKVNSEGHTFKIEVNSGKKQLVEVGTIKPLKPGYIRVDIQGISRSGAEFGKISELWVTPLQGNITVSYVKDNIDNRFYWGRRGPSVHLSYTMPQNKDIEWFYSEVTVPEGEDVVGSYFMANGFAEGYFGMQVNSETERRVIFSVWSPFATDNPEEIPEADRIRVIGKGKNTIAHDFGNEGSGGHSRIVFPWKAGVTYSFLNSARPDGNGNTIYSAWFFAPEVGEWQYITSFLRPKTDTWLKRLHSFLENFIDYNGYLSRMAWYGNQWACDTDGNWYNLIEARFTGDDIARRGYRLDYAGGAIDDRFYLKNGGFFNSDVKLNSISKRESEFLKPPEIDFNNLPKSDSLIFNKK